MSNRTPYRLTLGTSLFCKRMSLIASLGASSACAEVAAPDASSQSETMIPDAPEDHPLSLLGIDLLAHLPRGEAQRQILCARAGDDMLRDSFCAAQPITPRSLIDLQKVLYLEQARLSGVNGLAVAGHSTSLSARSISAINPRMIAGRVEHPAFDKDENSLAPRSMGVDPSLLGVALAYTRGEQFAEIMVRDRADAELRFYLFAFRQACNDSPFGCKPGDLLTPEVEKNWTETSLYDERDLANTVVDCAPCHQSNGPGTQKFLRMQELREPWTHWFGKSSDGGRALIADYEAARGDEEAFGLTGGGLMTRTNPVSLELQAVYGGPNNQPNPFDSATIEAEVRDSAAALGGAQPVDNTVAGDSPTWRIGYEAARRGESITFPYHDVKVTDPVKLAQMTEYYRAYRAGELDRSQLPDIREVFPDDLERLAEMGFTTKPGATGEEVLLEACAMCHNPRLDQTVSRARFRADLLALDRAEKDAAIARILLPESDPRHMPPVRARFLSAEARRRAIEVLRR